MTAELAGRRAHLSARLARWARRTGLSRKLALGLSAAAIVSGIATYAVMTGATPFTPDPNVVIVLLYLDLVLLLLLGTVVARGIVQLWTERRRGSAGSRLHVRLVMLFSLLAVTPTIVVAVFSVLFFNFGVQAWFSDRVRTALSESLAVADAYLNEHQQSIRADVLAIAQDLDRKSHILLRDPKLLSTALGAQAVVRSFPEAMLFDGSGRVLARSGLTYALEFDLIPASVMQRAQAGDVALMINDKGDRVRALVRLDRFVETYLYVGRLVEPGVLNHVSRTQEAVREYERLEGTRSGMQINFAMMFAVLALLLLLAAVWAGLTFATRLARPISGLISAAEQVRAGDLAARVTEGSSGDEVGLLSRAFNRMTSQLETQQRELMDANRQLDARRIFTEAVLAGVSAGVIGLDRDGRINLPNRTASLLLSTDLDGAIAQDLGHAVPEMSELVESARRLPQGLAQSQIKIVRNGRSRTLLVRVTAERGDGGITGFVVTFDDVTELLAAQRKAAWSDVARRIAHEIKNPLTPIQLSAERLKRKYMDEIRTDPDVFRNCTDTIVRQVGDIGRMVDEFSSFARMPSPIIRTADIKELAKQSVILQRSANPDIEYEVEIPPSPVQLDCDGRQIGQVLTNLLQNAAESIHGRAPPPNAVLPKGRVTVRVTGGEDQTLVEIEDNGQGFPTELREQLTEPYVTTRSKGTGLGLAIVRKIMEDHGGDLILEDREGGGARVRLTFNIGEATPVRPYRPDDEGRPRGSAAHAS